MPTSNIKATYKLRIRTLILVLKAKKSLYKISVCTTTRMEAQIVQVGFFSLFCIAHNISVHLQKKEKIVKLHQWRGMM